MAAHSGKWKWWTYPELKRLEELRIAGKKRREIAAILGRSVASIRGRLRHIEMPKPTSELLWMERFCQGLSDQELANRLGIQYKSVLQARRRLRRLGYTFTPGGQLCPT